MVRATTVKGYVQKIRARMKQVGTYRPEFQLTMERLARIYIRMKEAEDQFQEEGRQILVEQATSTGGFKTVKNPLLTEIDSLNKQALEIETALGLTPAALKKVNETAMPTAKKTEDDPLAVAIGQLRAIS